MNNWLESQTDFDDANVFSDDEYGLFNAAKFALRVFINKNTSSSCNDTATNETEKYEGLFSEEASDSAINHHVTNRSSLQSLGKNTIVKRELLLLYIKKLMPCVPFVCSMASSSYLEI